MVKVQVGAGVGAGDGVVACSTGDDNLVLW